MRSLATDEMDVVAGGFAGVRRLRNVRVERGWAHGELGDLCEPLEEYFGGSRPHVEFAKLSRTADALVRFSEQYGVVVDARYSEQDGGNNLKFPEDVFWFEQWRFRFLLKLASGLKGGNAFRAIYDEALETAQMQFLSIISRQRSLRDNSHLLQLGGLWQSPIRELHNLLGADEPTVPSPGTGLEYTKGLVQSARQKVITLSQEDLRCLAKRYLESSINQEIRMLRPLLDLNSDNGPRLYSLCDSVKQRLYWMLALDLTGRRLPRVCASCGDLFSSSKEKAVYCRKLECRVRERKRRNWERNKTKYNRARREKYNDERERERTTKQTNGERQ